MEIANVYSHLNGLEFMLVRKPELWQEIQDAIRNVDAGLAFDKVSREKNELANIVREGRSNPSVPVILIGIDP